MSVSARSRFIGWTISEMTPRSICASMTTSASMTTVYQWPLPEAAGAASAGSAGRAVGSTVGPFATPLLPALTLCALSNAIRT